jgi:endonuclease/exonuclease/phosphatase family metal-dependent hydrolase
MLKPLSLVGVLVASATIQIGCFLPKDDEVPQGPGFPVKVMTRNLYLGSDLGALATVATPQEIPVVAATIWANIQASDFPARAKVLAADIVAQQPDLVALQEVILYRRQIPSDGSPTPNAEEVVLDFLNLLTTEIAALGGDYRVAGEALNADAELPVADAAGPFDLRLTDRDVILARGGVATFNFAVMPFVSRLTIPVGGQGGVLLSTVRSVSRLGASVGQAHFTFANTHLEIGAAELIVQLPQAIEVRDWLASVPAPVLLLGDFNSNPGMSSYDLLTQTYKDAYTKAEPGFTCCQTADLMNADSMAFDRIDLILYRGRFRVNDARVTGSDPATGRTPSGLWASDHFGVAGDLELVP